MSNKRISKKKIIISNPVDFQHHVNVKLNQQTGDLSGLPLQWRSIIETKKRPEPIYFDNSFNLNSNSLNTFDHLRTPPPREAI